MLWCGSVVASSCAGGRRGVSSSPAAGGLRGTEVVSGVPGPVASRVVYEDYGRPGL